MVLLGKRYQLNICKIYVLPLSIMLTETLYYEEKITVCIVEHVSYVSCLHL